MAIPRRIPRALGNRHTGLRGGCCIEGGMDYEGQHKKDTRYLSFLSVVACLAVVFLHTNGCFWNFSATGRYWLTANIIESVFYFAVPVFFMISGATLIDYSERYSTTVFFKKRILKTVIPFVIVPVCIGVTMLLRKIPVIRRLLPD